MHTKLFILALLYLGLLSACGKSPAPEKAPPPATQADVTSANAEQTKVRHQDDKPAKPRKDRAYIETGDLPALKKRKVLRLLAPKWENSGLSRQGIASQNYRLLAEAFVKSLDLKTQWVMLDSIKELIPALNAGRGDLIIMQLAKTDGREQQVDFTLPLFQVNERLISSSIVDPETAINIETFLAGKRIIVGEGTSFSESIQQLSDTYPSLKVDVTRLSKNTDPDTLIDLINTPQHDVTVLDENVASSLKAYRDDFRVGPVLHPSRSIAWAIRKDSPVLLEKLNQFITETKIQNSRSKRYTSDFDAIKSRGTLRMITRNSPSSYFLWRGELMGHEYELIKHFADENHLHLEVIVAPPNANMFTWLKEGRGDLVAASLTITPERETQGIKFTRHYNKIKEQFVTGGSQQPIADFESLHERVLTLSPKHAYWNTALSLQKKLAEQNIVFDIEQAPETSTTSDILGQVAQGNYDVTLADSHIVAIEKTFDNTLHPGLTLSPVRKHGWALRSENKSLLVALNKYIKKNYRGLLFNVTYNKYFKNNKRIDKYQGNRKTASDALSPYDDIVKPLARRYQFDWRIIVSQMYQESKFNPTARSFAGAEGLLQVMPRTAKELGYALPFSPENGIEAGIKYLDWTRDRFEKSLPLEERLWFSLAAYNAGFGHVYDARRLAKQMGWDKNKWFDNVEKAMLLLSKRKYHSQSRFGYVRGQEPVHYVRQIKDRYHAYLSL